MSFYVFAYSGDKMDDVVPMHWFFYRSAVRHEMPLTKYTEAV
jgi:hypothetical protein